MPAANITENLSFANEVVLSERVVTSEYRIIEIQESIENRSVAVQCEIGPFVEGERGGQTVLVGSSRQNMVVWAGDAYDAIRDTWTNADLITAVGALMSPQT
jgi:hypothetical protein